MILKTLMSRVCRVQPPLRILVRLPSFIKSKERAEAGAFAAYHDASHIPMTARSYAANSQNAVWPHAVYVLSIFGLGGQPKITESVVQLYTINMVYKASGPRPGHVKPCKPMSGISNRKHFDAQIAIDGVHNTGPLALKATASVVKPRKFSGLRIVMKKIAQTLRGKIGLSHDALQLLIGQRPGSVSALAGPRHFNREHGGAPCF